MSGVLITRSCGIGTDRDGKDAASGVKGSFFLEMDNCHCTMASRTLARIANAMGRDMRDRSCLPTQITTASTIAMTMTRMPMLTRMTYILVGYFCCCASGRCDRSGCCVVGIGCLLMIERVTR